MTVPSCPLHGPMKLVKLTQGEGEEEKLLGWVWFCVNDDQGKPDYCDNCEDFTGDLQLNLFEETVPCNTTKT